MCVGKYYNCNPSQDLRGGLLENKLHFLFSREPHVSKDEVFKLHGLCVCVCVCVWVLVSGLCSVPYHEVIRIVYMFYTILF